jgi:SAM-dependent methyltransferase
VSTAAPVTSPADDLAARRETERAKYVTLAAREGSTYGSTNHGARAIPLIQRLRPRLVIDFGCGRNDLVLALRRLGIDGLGVDFAFPEADVPDPMHKTRLLSGVADVVTSFDALEHLLPEDVDAALVEMRRVARRRGHFILSVCTRPSRYTVAGANLHPTVQPLAWWLEHIGRVGVVSSHRAEGRYIVGRFKPLDRGCGCA